MRVPPRSFRPLAALTAAAAIALAAPAVAVEFKPTASLMADATWIDGDVGPDEDLLRMRRARVGFDVGTKGRWLFRIEHDLTDRSAAEASLQLTLREGDTLWLGQFKQPFLLEDAMSDRQTPFLEPALSGAFVLGRRMGIGFQRVRPDWTWTTAAFGQRLDGTQDRVGLSTRATRVLWREGDAFLHVGGSAAVEATEYGTFSVGSRPEAYFARSVVSTGALAGTDRVSRAGAELLWIDGPTSVQLEATALRAHRSGAADFTGSAASAVVGWSPTGHARGYARGAVGSPAAAAEQGGIWELFARASWIDLDDGAVRGGRAHNLSLGAVWYPRPGVRVMGNWIVVDGDRRGISDDPSIVSMRLQYVY